MVETQLVRPGVGANGIKIQVTVNAYKVTLPSNVVHHYDLAVQGLVGKGGAVGDVPPAFGRELFSHLRDKLKAFEGVPVVYDGRKNIFSLKDFGWPDSKKVFDVDISDNPQKGSQKGTRKFKVAITKVSQVKLDNLLKFVKGQVGSTPDEGVYTAITALNIICNHDVMMTCPSAKNRLFPPPNPLPQGAHQSDAILKMRRGLEMWRGYFSSVRMVPGGVILNFDLSSQPMIKPGNLAVIAAEIAGVQGGPPGLSKLRGPELIQLSRMLRLITVSVNRGDGTKLKCKIKEVGGSARSKTFEAPVSPDSEQMREWTVMEFIERTYNIKLKGPDLPLVRLTSRAWYPMEVCQIEPGQKYNKKLSPDQLAEAIKWLTVKPQERTQMLTQGIAQHLARSPSFGHWGLKLDSNPLTVPARKLPAPMLNLCTKHDGKLKPSQLKVENGSWNLAQKALFRPAAVSSWVAVAFGYHFGNFNPGVAKRAISDLESAMLRAGLNVSGLQRDTIFASNSDGPVYKGDTEDTVGPWIMSKVKSKPQLIVCFLKDKNAWQYRQIKVFGDTLQGIATQCLSIDKVLTRGNAQYYANVALKINAKLGGLNHALGDRGPLFKAKPTMVMGADVTHPGMDSMEPSIAAVVGSTNEHALGYAAEFSVQAGRQEIIADLDVMAKELLIKFHQRNGILPQRLIFYRDGVSEGQFPEVLAREIPLLRKALQKIAATAPQLKKMADAVKITFIVCGKRHHFKFGPSSHRDSDKSGNLLPGVIVDTAVTHPFDLDWYGLSHAGLLGTSRASHYSVLVDDTRHSADELQLLTYHLCYLYSRATRSVSIATPAYYAHHVCTRAKQMIGSLDLKTSSLTPTSSDQEQALAAYRTKANALRSAFRATYSKAGNFPVPEYWM